jgi:transposase
MKKNSTVQQSSKQGTKGTKTCQRSMTIGMDLGDKTSRYCALDEHGDVLFERATATSQKGMLEAFGALRRCRIALEVGTHSPWVSRLLKKLGHEVIVANARQVKLITQSSRKNDQLDAQTLARLARVDPKLLRPIQHRSEAAQQHLMVIRVRATLVETRTALVNSARGLAKSVGERLAKCDADNLDVERMQTLPEALQTTLKPLLEEVASVTEKIHALDERIEQIAREQYPETALLKQVSGVGNLIALTFLLTVEDPARFRKSREVGCYVGMRPKSRDSGESQPQLGISKEGDVYLRKLLVQGAHHILGRRGPDTDLQRWGLKLFARGGKNAKKRALVAVGRKLGVLLHCLWVSGEVYEPLRHSLARELAEQKKKVAA